MVKENQLQNVDFHTARVFFSRRALFHSTDIWDLNQLISVPSLDKSIIYKCRFLYSRDVDKIEFLAYTPKKIKRLFMVKANDLSYSYKYADREALEVLKKDVVKEPDEDILIVKDGLITDTSFSNIAFYNGTEWVTPDTPLLKGTKRAFYLDQMIIFETRITPSDIKKFEKARLINAMIDFESGNDIEIGNILEIGENY